MRLSKFSKKMIAFVCAIALVVTGLVFVPNKDAAAEDYSNLEYKVSDNNPNLAVAFVTQGGVTTSQEVNYCLDQGTNFYCATTAAFTKPDFKTVTCNGNVEDPARAGANFWIPMSVLNDNAYNVVTIEDAVGNTSQFVVRKGTPETPTAESTEAPSVEPSTEAPSESPTVEPSTEAPSESPTVEPSTEAPTGSGYDMHRLGYNTWTSLGGVFYAFTGEGNGAQVDVGYNADLNKAKTTQVSGGQWWTWNTQVAAVYPQYTEDVKAGKEYKIKWHIATENGASGNVILTTESGETQVDFSSGDLTVEGKLVYNVEIGEAAWCIGTMWIPEGVSVIFDDPEITGEEPTTEAPSVEPSTEAPSESPTVEPSTEAPTVEPTTEAPTQEPTTQAPTQKPTQAPTVKPTTPKPIPVIKIPGKAKVKKAVKKKKSAKKIKVKIKKIKGAKGYQVAVYKTKKKAKKNKKALVKKFTKKTKLTIKSKKFKKKKKLYVKVRAYTLDGTVKVFGAWSKPKKTKKK